MQRGILLVLVLACCHLVATPEMRKKGQFRFNLNLDSYKTTSFWNREGVRMPTYNTFRQKEIEAELQYGLTWTDTISLRTFFERFEENLNGNRQGFRQVQLGWRHRLLDFKKHCISSEVYLLIPPKRGYTPPVRYGEWGGEANLIAYRYFCIKKRVGYYDFRLGYRKYCGFPSDQIRFKGEIGIPLIPSLLAITALRLEYGLFNGQKQFNASLEELNPNYRLLILDLHAKYCLFKGFQIRCGLTKHLWGQNVGTGGSLFGGICVTY